MVRADGDREREVDDGDDGAKLQSRYNTQEQPDATCYYPAGLSVSDRFWVGIGYLPHRRCPLRAASCGPFLGQHASNNRTQ